MRRRRRRRSLSPWATPRLLAAPKKEEQFFLSLFTRIFSWRGEEGGIRSEFSFLFFLHEQHEDLALRPPAPPLPSLRPPLFPPAPPPPPPLPGGHPPLSFSRATTSLATAENASSTPSLLFAEVSKNGMPNSLASAAPWSKETARLCSGTSALLPTSA